MHDHVYYICAKINDVQCKQQKYKTIVPFTDREGTDQPVHCIAPDKSGYPDNIFLFLEETICLEVPPSNENPQCVFL